DGPGRPARAGRRLLHRGDGQFRRPGRTGQPPQTAGPGPRRHGPGRRLRADRRLGPAMAGTLFTRRASVFALATLCCLLWGSAYPAIKGGYALLGVAASDTAAQMLFAGWRFLLAGVILLAVTAALKKPIFALDRP